MTVILVTFSEAYLEQIIRMIVTSDLSKAQLQNPFLNEAVNNWVRSKMRSGDIYAWTKIIRTAIGPFCSDTILKRLKAMWDERHTTVHTATNEPARESFREYLALVSGFVTMTDDFIVSRLTGAAPGPTAENP